MTDKLTARRHLTRADQAAGSPLNLDFLAQGAEVSLPFRRSLDGLRDTVLARAKAEEPAMSRKLTALASKITRFETSVTVFGQARAGKSALVNVMIGRPGLLPEADLARVPLITSLHLTASGTSGRNRARFRFVNAGEWAAGQPQGDRTLPPDLQALLGKSHRIKHLNQDIAARYLCADLPDHSPGGGEGHFAPITGAAEVWLTLPQIGGSYLLRDMPGLHDHAPLADQIPVGALRGARICVAVLSAHEALDATDLALVRLISQHGARELILFVNGIDELASPYEEVEALYNSISTRLRRYRRLKDVKIIFGSARWAALALRGDCSGLDDRAQAALDDWARNCDIAANPQQMPHLWKLSGLPELMRTINDRVVAGSGAAHLAAMRASFATITAARAAREALSAGRESNEQPGRVDADVLRDDLGAIVADARRKLNETLARLETELAPSLKQVREDYVTRATQALADHMRQSGDSGAWSFNSSGLRLVLRTTSDRFAARARAQVETVFHAVAGDLNGLCAGAFGPMADGARIQAPQVPKLPSPVVLGRTIVIETAGSWWQRWRQRRRSPEIRAAAYSDQIDTEIGAIITELRENELAEILAETRSVFDRFLIGQSARVLALLAALSGPPLVETPLAKPLSRAGSAAAADSSVVQPFAIRPEGDAAVRDAAVLRPDEEGFGRQGQDLAHEVCPGAFKAAAG